LSGGFNEPTFFFVTCGSTRPDNQVIDFNYSSGGELSEIVLPKGTQTFGYDAVTRQITTVADEASGLTLSYHTDGPLLLKETWAGNWTGSVNSRRLTIL